jgi:colanic acid/amylovoran biosynthesis glycosyltransferase
MLTVAYLANVLPSAVEPYVMEEIEGLRKRGVQVVGGSVRRPLKRTGKMLDPQIVLQSWNPSVLANAVVLCARKWTPLAPLLKRILFYGREGWAQRVKAIVHTFMGACYATLLERRGVEHIHVHHGYFGSWIAMTAARLLGVPFSITLHGSDLLLHGAYLDTKLAYCAFCVTISEYNRNYILREYPGVDAGKVLVSRLGVGVCEEVHATGPPNRYAGASFGILTVGRLHAVKDHAFLVRACSELAARGLNLQCEIAGDGPERKHLERLISSYGLSDRVRLLGHARREETNALYDRADLIVITSRSEGIPLVLMEAMARGKIVLAPAITGIPELITAGETGFLYEPGSMCDFVGQVLRIHSLAQPLAAETLIEKDEKLGEKIDRRCCSPPADSTNGALEKIGRAAREQVRRKFNRNINLERFAETFIERVRARSECNAHENPVLQQVQLSLQRNRSLPV